LISVKLHSIPLNILLILLDSTRVDACSCYGAKRLITPNLDKLAAEGVLFEQAISPAPWTLPAIASLFTGLYPSQIGVYTRGALATTYSSLTQQLSQNGYATFGITNNSWLSVDFGLQRGFDVMHKQWQWLQTSHDINKLVLLEGLQGSSWIGNLVCRLLQGNLLKNILNIAYTRFLAYRRDLGASRILRPLARWIDSQQGQWFAFVHYMEAHLPYKPPREWASRFVRDPERAKRLINADQLRLAWRHIAGKEMLSEDDLAAWRDLYLAEVAYVDYHLGLLIDWLKRTGRLDNTLVIVTADHGENLGEHGLLDHKYCLYDTLLRVPLVMRCPPLVPAGQRISYQVQTLDIFATILEVAGIEAPPSASKSLLSESERRPFVIAEYGIHRPPLRYVLERYGLQRKDLAHFERGLIALRTNTHKLILGTDGSQELYAWPDDPEEEHNIATQHPKLVKDLRNRLEVWRREHRDELASRPASERKVALEVEVKERLRALGYLE
jgi:arylsulfatase A-like enzyme